MQTVARVAKLVDAPDLGSGVLRRVGSSPITRTIGQKRNFQERKILFSFLGNRQRKPQKVTRSTAPVAPRGLRKTSVVNFHFTPFSFFKIDNGGSNWSQAAWQSHALRDATRRRCQFSKEFSSFLLYHINRQCGQQQAVRCITP